MFFISQSCCNCWCTLVTKCSLSLQAQQVKIKIKLIENKLEAKSLVRDNKNKKMAEIITEGYFCNKLETFLCRMDE